MDLWESTIKKIEEKQQKVAIRSPDVVSGELFKESDLVRTYNFLGHKQQTELRLIDPHNKEPPRSIFVNNINEFLTTIKQWNGKYNIYAGINERKNNGTTKDDVVSVKTIVIDIDPVRPKNSASNQTELDNSQKKAEQIINDCKKAGFTKPGMVCSGNGIQLWFAIPEIDLTNTTQENKDTIEQQIQKFQELLQKKYSDEQTKIDKIGDLPRIIKVIGTLSIKGENTPDRPHRVSHSLTDFERQEDNHLQEEILSYPVNQTKQVILPEPSQKTKEFIQKIISTDEKTRKVLEGDITGHVSRSEAEQTILCQLIKNDIPKEQIYEIMQQCKIGKWQTAHPSYRERSYVRAKQFMQKVIVEQQTRVVTKKSRGSDEEDVERNCTVEKDGKIYEIVFKDSLPQFVYLNDNSPHYVLDVDGTKPQFGEEVSRGIVLLPTSAEPFGTIDELLEEIRVFIKKYCDLPEDYIRISAYYIILSYFFDRLDQIPYLSFMGDTGTGKSRCKMAIGSLCYLPILTSGGTSPAAFYRLIDKWKGTLLIDEADFKQSDESQEIVKLLNCGYEKHSPRVVCNKENPDKLVFNNAYCPKIISRRFEFYDKAIESRCITHITQQTMRKDILVVLPPCFYTDATRLRNKLLMLRLQYWYTYNNPTENVLADLGIEPRLQQAYTSLALVLSAFPQELEKFKKFLVEKNVELINERASTVEGEIINAYVDLLGEGVDAVSPTLIADRIRVNCGDEVSNRSIGKKLKALGFKSVPTKVLGKTVKVVKIPEGVLALLLNRYVVPEKLKNEEKVQKTLKNDEKHIKGYDSYESYETIRTHVTKKNGDLSGSLGEGGCTVTDVTNETVVTDDQKTTKKPQNLTGIIPTKPTNPPNQVLQQITKIPTSFEHLENIFCKSLDWPVEQLNKTLLLLKQNGDVLENKPGYYVKLE